MPSSKLPRRFYTRSDTLQVARDLLGRLLVVPLPDGQRVSGAIVEAEAYMGPEDKASHAFGSRRTNRTEPMFGIGGHAYVYLVYGMHFQFNVVTGEEGIPHAVLIRALQPVEGTEWMRERRKQPQERDLTNGPGKLCQALGIDLQVNNEDLLGDRIWIEKDGINVATELVSSGPRVGIDYAEEFINSPWRFWIKDNEFVSRPGRRSRATRPGTAT